MNAIIPAPVDLMEEVAALRLPPKADERLQALMDRNTNGQLSPAEHGELEAWVEVSERLSLVRAKVLHLLGRKP
jgi:hypothetical protein